MANDGTFTIPPPPIPPFLQGGIPRPPTPSEFMEDMKVGTERTMNLLLSLVTQPGKQIMGHVKEGTDRLVNRK